MRKSKNSLPVYKLFVLQILMGVILTVLLYFTSGVLAAKSAYMAGLVAIVPNLIFARTFFRYRGARAARQIATGFYVGEALKLLTTFAMFAWVFGCGVVNPAIFFITYIVMIMSMWFAPLILAAKKNRSKT